MTNVAYTTLTKVGRRASHGVTLEVIKGVKKGVKLKLIVSLHPVLCCGTGEDRIAERD